MSVKTDAMRALDVQLGLISFYKSDIGRRYCEGFMANVFKEDEFDNEDQWQAMTARSGQQVAHGVAGSLNVAATYVVTDDMMTLALKAGSTVPRTPFTEDDLPTPQGFVMLPRPLLTQDIHGKVMSTRAFCWWQSTVSRMSPIAAEMGLGGNDTHSMILAYFSDKNDMTDEYNRDMKENHRETWLSMETFSMSHWQPIGFGEDWAKWADETVGHYPQASRNTMVEWSAFQKSFFLLIKQKVAVLHPQGMDRATARRMKRSPLMPDNGDIQVVTLRKERPDSINEISDGTPIEWSHRWIVSGHWRNQWYPSEQVNKPIFITAYEKGPIDKPLVIKDKVFVWKR